MADGGERATIRDVARTAGVSTRTVTRVVNGLPNVGQEMRRRTEEAVRRLGYAPDPRAQGLAWGRSSLVGLIFDNPSPEYILSIQRGALSVLQPAGLSLVVHAVEQAGANFPAEVGRFASRLKLAGLLLAPPLSEDPRLPPELDAVGCPFVRIGSVRLDRPDRSVVGRDREGARAAARHLAGLGHRRIGLLNGPSRFISAGERRAGFLEGLAEAGLEVPEELEVEGDYTFASGAHAGERLLSRSSPPTAVFAANDQMAAGLLRAASKAGLETPADLSVVGFDDLELASRTWPPLTSVRLPSERLGALAAARLVRRGAIAINEEEPRPELVIRSSTAPPRRG